MGNVIIYKNIQTAPLKYLVKTFEHLIPTQCNSRSSIDVQPRAQAEIEGLSLNTWHILYQVSYRGAPV